MSRPRRAAFLGLLLLAAFLHDGPDPIGSWRLSKEQVQGKVLRPLLGVPGRIDGPIAFVKDAAGDALFFDGKATQVVLADDIATTKQALPKRHLTLDAWVAINTPRRWGGILGTLQDNGDSERGLILGYDEQAFTFGLATVGADDGDGKMTYVKSKTRYEEGRFYHVAGTYDGEVQRLYVNGNLEVESRVQSGDVLYPKSAPLILGGYRDQDEDFRFHGRIRSARIFDQTATAKAVRDSYRHGARLTEAPPHLDLDPELRWVVHPYLQWVTRDGITFRFETSRPTTAIVRWDDHVELVGQKEARQPVFERQIREKRARRLHELRLGGLESGRAYYYRVEVTDDQQRTLKSPVLSFQAAPQEATPFAFAVISDTQGNPEVAGKLARHAWGLRPNFLLHPGDLVDTGTVKEQWAEQFFASMKPLTERVALFPVLGNHERDARFYYDYMSLPDPEYYYEFRYGNAHFFMLDTNREVGPGSPQYQFLQRALARSKATWKVLCHHHPAYSSDENDYGDTWYGPSTRGDLRVRKLVPLIEKHGVDLVWNGHIHSYERTWPLRRDRATSADKGTVYMITGGGGGSLETPGPIRPFFQNTVRRGHHFCFVAVNGKTLEMKAYDVEGRLFDTLKIEKR